MPEIKRTDSDNPDFINLVKFLDAELRTIYHEQQDFYDQFNRMHNIKNIIVAYEGEIPVGCGAIKQYDAESMEIKRMYVKTDFRGKGIAGNILRQLELWAAELAFTYCVLETGNRQENALKLYRTAGYHVIPNYGQYVEDENSVCMKKRL